MQNDCQLTLLDGSEDIYLVEVSEDLLKNESSLWIRGSPEDEATLCTDKQSFRLKFVQTSNTLMLAEADGSVHMMTHSYLEIAPTRPNFDRLEKLLCENTLDSHYKAQSVGVLTHKFLLENIPSSQQEIMDFVSDRAVLLNDSYWSLTPYLEHKFCRTLLKLLDDGTGEVTHEEYDKVLQLLQEFHDDEFLPEVSAALLPRYLENSRPLSLKRDAVISAIVHGLLQNKTWTVGELRDAVRSDCGTLIEVGELRVNEPFLGNLSRASAS